MRRKILTMILIAGISVMPVYALASEPYNHRGDANAKPYEKKIVIYDDVKDEIDIISDEEIEYIARCVQAEAGNQDDYGKELVIDVILNRIDSEKFPDTAEEVINQKYNGKYQFSVVANGSINKVDVSNELLLLVRAEIKCRGNRDVLFFRTGNYHSFGTPVLQHGAHYFSK